MSAEPTITTVESGGFTITSNSGGSPEQIAESLKVGQDTPPSGESEPPDLSKAASELGKKGGEAAAKARAKADKQKAKEAKEAETGEAAEAKASDQDAAEEPEQPAEPEKDAKKGNPRHDPTARVAQATREAAEAKRRAAELEARLERLERERTAAPTPPTSPQGETSQPAEDAEPREEDFESYRDFVKATAKWQYRQEAREAQKQYQAHQIASAYAQRIDSSVGGFKGAVEKAVAADPEFYSKVSSEVMDVRPSFTLDPSQRPNGANWIADDFLSAPERAPALMLYLSEHPQDFQRIAALSSPRAITRELAKIEIGLEAATAGTSTRPESSKANPPVRPVTGAPSVADNAAPRSNESFDDWVRRIGKNHPSFKR